MKASVKKKKTVAKPAAKAARKTVVKSAPAKKPAAKAPAKKSPAKAPQKTPAAKKPAAKQPAAKKPVVKPAAKAVAAKKSAAKKVVARKPAAKASPTRTPLTKKPLAKKPEPKRAAPVKPTAKAAAPTPPPTAKPAAPAVPAATVGEPVRTSKAAARLAQITVPSMAQTLAATTAKSSYVSTMPANVLTPAAPMGARKDPKLANNWKSKPAEALSDAEVLAMPDGEYMNDKQLAFFRLRLVHLKQDILNNAGETTEHLREDTVIVPDPADRATIEEEHALELRTRDRERKLLKKIEQSIARIDSGDYGYCDETGEPIGVGRLLARPTATLSLEAQQRRELKQKMFGD